MRLLPVVLVALAPCTAAAARLLPFTPVVDHLQNGMQVVTVKTATPGIVAYYTVARTGARDEVEPGKSGFAHFFEHMMFRGTPAHPSADYDRTLAAHGADNNAYTTADYTAYFTVTPVSGLADVMALESDRFQHLAYTEPAFRTEAGAVLGEYNKAFSSPGLKMWETLSDLGFDAHTYQHTTIGYLKDIKAMPEGYEYSRSFFRRHYQPDNCTVLLVGDVDRAKVLPMIAEAYGGWRGQSVQTTVPFEPPQTAARRRDVSWTNPTPPRLMVGWRVPGAASASVDTAALRVLGELVAGETSPLYQKWVVREQRAIRLGHDEGMRRDPFLFTLGASLKRPADFDPLLTDIQAALDTIAAGEVDAAAAAAAASSLRYAQLMHLETPGAIAGHLAAVIGRTGDPANAEAALEHLAEVTPADLSRIAGAHFKATQQVVVTLANPTQKGGAK